MDRSELERRVAACGRIIAEQERSGAPDVEAVLDAHRKRTWALWLLEEAEACWREYELLTALEESARGPAPGPRAWDGSPLAGRSLVVHLYDGGLGDLIQFVRFVGSLDPRQGRVTVLTRRELLRLFSSSFDPGLAWITSPDEVPHADLEAGFFALPFVLRWRLDRLAASVPYLRPAADLASAWRRRLADLPRPWVGVRWSNTREHGGRDARSAPLPCFAPLLERGAGSFLSLEKESHAEEIEQSGFAGKVLDFGDELGNLDDTAALMANLDLVVSIDTSIGHLAGALGRPTWLLLQHDPFEGWRLGSDPHRVPWYPTTRLCLQPQPGRWDLLLAELGSRLPAFAEGVRSARG